MVIYIELLLLASLRRKKKGIEKFIKRRERKCTKEEKQHSIKSVTSMIMNDDHYYSSKNLSPS